MNVNNINPGDCKVFECNFVQKLDQNDLLSRDQNCIQEHEWKPYPSTDDEIARIQKRFISLKIWIFFENFYQIFEFLANSRRI